MIFLLILLVLVLSHEFGHFIIAKWRGVKVEEFAFGFPPRLFSVKKGETKYSFNLLPLGGYVKIPGEDGETDGDPRSFTAQPFLTKFGIIIAGVIFNLILAYILISASFMIGIPVPLEDEIQNAGAEVKIVAVEKGSPAQIAGIEPGDTIRNVSFGGEQLSINKITEVRNFILDHKGKEISLSLLRSGNVIEAKAVIRSEVRDGQGALGIEMARIGIERTSIFGGLAKGFSHTADMTVLTGKALFSFFGSLFSGRESFESVSGPIGIARIVRDFSRFGFIFLVQLTALLSINLAIINLIPFPGLDGGRALLLIIEQLKGSPFNAKVTRAIHATGFAFLLALIALVTYHDIVKMM